MEDIPWKMKRINSEESTDQVEEAGSSKFLKDSSKTDVASSGDAKTFLHSNPLSKGEHIDDYTSPDGEKMSFFYFSDSDTPIWVQFKDRNTEKTSPLWTPKLYVNRNRDYLLLKIREYLKDKNLRPEYCRLNKQVRFFSVHPKKKCWFLEDHCLSLPKRDTVSIHQLNGCVSYVNNKNQVITWDWRDNRSHERSIPARLGTITITALAEQNDSLIVGYEDGQIFVSYLAEVNASLIIERENKQIFVPKCIWIWPKKSSVVEIVAVGPSYFAVRYKDNSENLIISENGKVIRSLDQILGIWSVDDRFLVSLRSLGKKKVLSLLDVVENEIVNEKDFSSELTKKYVAVLSDTIHVAMDKEISIWKRSNNSWITLKKNDFLLMWQWYDGVICIRNPSEYKCICGCINTPTAEDSWKDLISSIKKKNFIFLPPGMYVFPQFPQCLHWKPFIAYFSTILKQQKHPKTLHVTGNWSITSMTLLSDGSLMYATDTRDSGIHVITIKGEQVFSSKELIKDSSIVELKEMACGSVATRCKYNNIRIITPRFVLSKNLIQVTELRSKLTSDPNNLDLYKELAEKFLSRENSNVFDHYSAYHTYLDGLEAAVQIKNLHRARRFYEKVKNIFPDRDEPMRLFLSYLMQFPNNQIERNIHLDLLEVLKNKNCKRRLFVGEGDFSFTEALLKKHICGCEQLPLAIVATELEEPLDEVNQRINWLLELGVRIMFKVDAQKIHETFKDERFERIHWNCPFGSDLSTRGRNEFREVIPNFFCSCEKIQSIGDRIHVTLVQDGGGWVWNNYRQYENPIVEGSMKSEYRLVRKRHFGEQRYRGYQHRSTQGEKLHFSAGKLREFIFEKVSTSVFRGEVTNRKIKNSEPMQNVHKQYYIKVNKIGDSSSEIKPGECYFECSTDEDSSDYYSD